MAAIGLLAGGATFLIGSFARGRDRLTRLNRPPASSSARGSNGSSRRMDS